MFMDISELTDLELEELHTRNIEEDLPCFLSAYYTQEGSLFRTLDKKWINKLILKKEIERRLEK